MVYFVYGRFLRIVVGGFLCWCECFCGIGFWVDWKIV